MPESKASRGLVIASILCLTGLAFAVFQILLAGAWKELSDFADYMGGWPAHAILRGLPLGVGASIYVLVFRRRPKSVLGTGIPDERQHPKSTAYWIGMAVLGLLVVLVFGIVICSVFFTAPMGR